MEKRSQDKANGVATPKKTTTASRSAPPTKKEPRTLLDVTLLAPDALECPLCFEPFEAAIFQCKNGHAACGSCCDRVRGSCPSCRDPIGAIRCRPLENAIAAMLVPCGFAAAGCTETLRYAQKRAHEAAACRHAPCACPVPGCAYAGLLLHDHIRDAHQRASGGGGDDEANDAVVSFVREATVALRLTTPFRVLLHARDSRVFLLLNGGGVPSGRSLSLLSVGLRPSEGRALEYTMVVRAAGGENGGGALSLSASGPVPCTRRWEGADHLPAEGFLFVPDAYWSSSGSVSVTVRLGTEAGGRGAGRRHALDPSSPTAQPQPSEASRHAGSSGAREELPESVALR